MHRRLWRWPYTARKDTYRCPWLEKAPSTLAGGHFLHIWRHLLQAGAQDTNGSIYIGNCVQFKDGIARDSCTRLFQHATPPKNCEQGSRRGSQNVFFVLIFWWSVYLFTFYDATSRQDGLPRKPRLQNAVAQSQCEQLRCHFCCGGFLYKFLYSERSNACHTVAWRQSKPENASVKTSFFKEPEASVLREA